MNTGRGGRSNWDFQVKTGCPQEIFFKLDNKNVMVPLPIILEKQPPPGYLTCVSLCSQRSLSNRVTLLHFISLLSFSFLFIFNVSHFIISRGTQNAKDEKSCHK